MRDFFCLPPAMLFVFAEGLDRAQDLSAARHLRFDAGKERPHRLPRHADKTLTFQYFLCSIKQANPIQYSLIRLYPNLVLISFKQSSDKDYQQKQKGYSIN